MKKAVRECGRPVITTCTECAAALAGAGCNVYHSLTLLMGLDEHPAIGVSSMKALVKFYIALRPLAVSYTHLIWTEPLRMLKKWGRRQRVCATPFPAL